MTPQDVKKGERCSTTAESLKRLGRLLHQHAVSSLVMKAVDQTTEGSNPNQNLMISGSAHQQSTV